MTEPHVPGRRAFLARSAASATTVAATAVAAVGGLAGCERAPVDWRARVDGRWLGAGATRGHRVRDRPAPPAGAPRERRADVLVIGAGIAGLAAARALRAAGIDDFAVLELEDTAGGNSRGHAMAGLPCPLGAHYLPLPGPQAAELQDFLCDAGLAQRGASGLRWDERALCHSPQERLFIDGRWQDGLLPAAAPDSPTQAQYRRFAQAIAAAQRGGGYAIPTHRVPFGDDARALDAQSFDRWLAAQGLADARLRTYLDYCCRDDYGAGSATVSAWAGVHYFASRHGFAAPGDDAGERDALLTWPEGNARLVRSLCAPLGDRLQPGRAVFRVRASRSSVEAWAYIGDGDPVAQTPGGRIAVEHWTARHAVLALPLFVAARVLENPPAALTAAAARVRHAPWLVANLRLAGPPIERHGAPMAWDNVVHGSASLGYVNAQHQGLAPLTQDGDRLLTAYWALPEAQRGRLLGASWQQATQWILDDLHTVHPDLSARLRQADLIRHGHAMSIPVPGLRGDPALAALASGTRGAAGDRSDRSAGAGSERIAFAHADLSAYSIFEEAFAHGGDAGRHVARRLRGAG